MEINIFLIFPTYHDFYVQINSDLKIYIEPHIYKNVIIDKMPFNSEHRYHNELTKLLPNNIDAYINVDFIENEYIGFDLFLMSGMIHALKKNKKNVDVDNFYIFLEKNNRKDLIPTFDKYIQHEFIKIFEIDI